MGLRDVLEKVLASGATDIPMTLKADGDALILSPSDNTAGPKTFPYEAIDDLPDGVKDALPVAAQKIYLAAFNAAYAKYESDERAAKIAWGAVKNAGYVKQDDGKWKKSTEAVPFSSLNLLMIAPWRFGEIPTWINVLPGPGRWEHPWYGIIEMTEKSLDEFKANAEDAIYQEHIPITAEHDTKQSGAVGYYGPKWELRGEGYAEGLWNKVEWNDRGKQLLAEGRFRYFSPEMFDLWTDPATDEKYYNVLCGGAICTKPFFKDNSLAPLVATEGGMWDASGETWRRLSRAGGPVAKVETEDAQPSSATINIKKYGGGTVSVVVRLTKEQLEAAAKGEELTLTDEQEKAMKTAFSEPAPETKPEPKEDDKPMSMSEEVAKQFADLTANLDAEKARGDAAESAIKTMREAEDQRWAEGFVKEHRMAFRGEVSEATATLLKFKSALPHELFEAHLSEKRAVHKSMSESPILRQTSNAGPSPVSASGLEAAARKIMTGDATLTLGQAMVKAAEHNPELYAEYNRGFIKATRQP